METLRRRCEEAPSRGWTTAEQDSACKDILNYITDPIGDVDQMDASHFDYEHFIDK